MEIIENNKLKQEVDFPAMDEAEHLAKIYLIGDVKRDLLKHLLDVRKATRSVCDLNQELKQIITDVAEIAAPQDYDSQAGLEYRLNTITELLEKGLNLTLEEIIETANNRRAETLKLRERVKYLEATENKLRESIRSILNAAEFERDSQEMRIAELERKANALEGAGAADIEEREQTIREQEEKYRDLSESFDNWLNDVWALVYPGDFKGWVYPAQVYRHIRDYLAEKDSSIVSLRETITRLTGMLEFIEKKAEETLRDNYAGEQDVSNLRESLRQICENAKYPFLCPDCKGSGKIVDSAASHIQKPCPKCSTVGESYAVGVDPAREGGDFTAQSIINTVKNLPFVELRVSEFMPKDYGILLDGKTKEVIKIINFKGIEEGLGEDTLTRLETLRRETERQERIDLTVNTLLGKSKE